MSPKIAIIILVIMAICLAVCFAYLLKIKNDNSKNILIQEQELNEEKNIKQGNVIPETETREEMIKKLNEEKRLEQNNLNPKQIERQRLNLLQSLEEKF